MQLLSRRARPWALRSPPTLMVQVMVSKAPSLSKGQDLVVQVVRVIDGDTLEVEVRYGRSRGHRYRVRLFAIDAPEMAQPLGRTARDYLTQRIAGATCRMRVMDMDRYRRVVAVVYRHRFRHSVNLDMVRAGYAYYYARYGTLSGLQQAENQARHRRRGVWRRAGQTPPWQYRQGRRRSQRPKPGRTRAKRGCAQTWVVLGFVLVLVWAFLRIQG